MFRTRSAFVIYKVGGPWGSGYRLEADSKKLLTEAFF